MSLIDNIKGEEVAVVDLTTVPLADRPMSGGMLSKVLNENCPGKQGGMCVVFGAPSGVGKTTFTLMEVSKSLDDGKKVLYYTTESDPTDILITLCKIKNITDVDKRKEYIDSICDRFNIVDEAYNIYHIKYLCEHQDFDELYLDYLDTSMCNADTAAEKSSVINYNIRLIREHAKEYNKFVWVCAQAKNLPEGQYTTDSFRESTAMCNATTLALILHKRREAIDTEMESTYVLEVVKNRYIANYAPTGTKIFFNSDNFIYQERGYSVDGEVKQYIYYHLNGKDIYNDLFST